MPRVLEVNGYVFFFFSNEGDPAEPCHIHVRKSGSLAKFWIEPAIRLASSDGFNSKDLKEISHIIRDNLSEIKEAWNEFFCQ